MKPRLLFYCQHVLGMGHLIRSMEILRGLGEFDVTLLSGGTAPQGLTFPDGIEVVQLPALEADSEFCGIHAATTGRSLEALQNERRETILATFERVQPESLVIELFPFGRRKFGFELLPLLEHVRKSGSRTQVVCSLRDILVSKRDQARWEDQVCWLINQYFDLLLIHSDPSFQRLEETFGRTADLACDIRYTGFVAQPMPAVRSRQELGLSDDGKPLLVASIGGGRVGTELLAGSIEASHCLGQKRPHRLVAIGGPYITDADWSDLAARARGSESIVLQRYTPHFLNYLAHADLSISMGGYNTSMNILTAQVPALVLPFTGNQNEEQTIRARKLEELGVLEMLAPSEIDGKALAARIVAALARRAASPARTLDTNGVANSARLLAELWASRQVPA